MTRLESMPKVVTRIDSPTDFARRFVSDAEEQATPGARDWVARAVTSDRRMIAARMDRATDGVEPSIDVNHNDASALNRLARGLLTRARRIASQLREPPK